MSGVNAPPVLFVAGKHPIREIGGFGHSGYVRSHARAATLAGYDPQIFCFGGDDVQEHEPFGTVHQQALHGSPRQREIRSLGPRLADAIVAFANARPAGEPILIHGFGVWTYAATLARRRLPGRRVAIVASSYTTHLDESRAMFAGSLANGTFRQRVSLGAEALWSALAIDRYERLAYRDADILAVNYDAVRRAIVRRHGDSANARIVRYTSDQAFVHPALASPPRPARVRPKIVSLSGHFQRKGIDVLLHAYALLRDRGIPFEADLIGGGSLLEAHRVLATRLGLDDLVRIRGVVPDVAPYLTDADIFVLPSRSEQSGALALIEALSHGLPAVASACDGIPEDLTGSEAGILVEPGQAGALAEALGRLLADPEERARRSMAARELFRERFSPQAFASDIGRMYEEVLAPR